MKKIYILILILFAIPVISQIQIGSGTSTTDRVPIYGRDAYSISQQIVLNSEYIDAGGAAGNITKIKWFVNSFAPDSANWDLWDVYISHTTKTSFTGDSDFVALTSLTPVFSGTINPVAGQWMELTLTTPFNFNGVDNILVTVIDKKSGYSSFDGKPFFRSYTATARGIYASQDSGPINTANLSANSGKSRTNTVAQLQFVGQEASCLPLTNLAVNAIVSNQATVTWTNRVTTLIGQSYELRTDTNVGNATGRVASGTLAATATSQPLTNLTPDTVYYFYVKNNCSATDSSGWKSIEFRTACAAASIPYIVNIASSTALPNCTSVQDVNNDGKTWAATAKPSSSGFVDANVMKYSYSTSVPANDWFYIQELNLVAGQSYRLSFKYRDSGFVEKLRISLGAIGVNTSMTTELGTVATGTASATVKKHIDFIPATSGRYYIGFQAYSDINQNILYLGDIKLDLSPTCFEATDVQLQSVAVNTANFRWTASRSIPANGYAYEVRTSGEPGEATGLVLSGTTAPGVLTTVVSGLTANTVYKFYVKAVCSPTDSSPWSEAIEFRTECSIESIPYALNIDDVVVPNIPFCIAIQDVNDDEQKWKSYSKPSGTSFVGTKVMGNPAHRTNAANDWFYTHAINLVAGQSYRLKFKYADSSSEEKLRVSYGSAKVNTAMNTEITTVTTGTSRATVEKVVDFTPTVSGVYYIGFQSYSDANKNILYVGDVSVDFTPTCFVPGAITVNAATLTHNSVVFTWGAPEQAPVNGYEYEIRTSGNPGEATGRAILGTTAAGVLTATVNGLQPLTNYKIYVRSACIGTDRSIWTEAIAFKTLCEPPVLISTTGGTICGIGETTLQATYNSGTAKWYETATSTAVLGTGTTFVTPEISQTTSYWVSAVSENARIGHSGKAQPQSDATGYSVINWGLVFNIAEDIVLKSTDVYATSNNATVDIKIVNAAGVEIYSTGVVNLVNGGTTTANVVPLNVALSAGNGYKILIKSYSGTIIRESSGLSFPYRDEDNILTVTASEWGGTTTGNYYYFYNLAYEARCTTARTEVVATVTEAPALTLSTNAVEICREATSAAVQIATGASNYDTYVWTPATGVTGNATTGWTFSPAVTTVYSLMASQSTGVCKAKQSVTVTVKDTPEIGELPETLVLCPEAIGELTAGGDGIYNAVFGTGTSATGTTSYPNPLSAYHGGVKTQMLYTKDELLAKGLRAGCKITTLSFELNAFAAKQCNDFTIRMGHTTGTAMALTNLATSSTLTSVYNQSFTPSASGLVTFTLTTPFVWDGTSNLIIETVHNAGNSGNGSGTTHRYTTTTFDSVVYGAKDNTPASGVPSMDAVTAYGSSGVSKNRPNIQLGFVFLYRYEWTPRTGLYTNPEATIPYTGDSQSKVYVKNTASENYTLTVTQNTTLCAITREVEITINNTLTPAAVDQTFCISEHKTIADLTVTGTNVLWYANATTTTSLQTNHVLANGTYYATQTLNGCESVMRAPVIVTMSNIVVTPNQTDVLCHGFSTGKANVVVSGGVTPYSYSWDNGITSTTNEVIDLSAGTYTVTVTDANGCTTTETFTISEPTVLSITPTQTDILCHGALTGKASVVVNGGVTPYSYSWDNGITSTTNEATDLSAGTYTVTVTDVNGCTITETFTITEPTALSITPSQTDVLCHGASTGTASVVVSGGVTPYSYSWDNGITSTTNEATDLSAGTYTVTVTDANGCTTTETFTISEPTVLSITPTQTDVLCHGFSTGKANVVVSSGVTPYSYSWDNGITSTTNEATDLSAGTYKVTVTDANGCNITETFTITEPTALSITPSQTDVSCHGASTGKASVAVSGGLTPYSYSWDNGITSTTNEATDLSAGTYTVTVTDANGCATTENFTITEPTALDLTPNQKDVLCYGALTGKASVVVNGGVIPYSYSWDNGITSTTNEATDLSAGTYTVTVTDANGCIITETFTISEPTALDLTPNQTDVLCHGALTGKASVVLNGGVTPYSYSWDNGITSTTNEATDLSAGTYKVTVTDANGCTITETFTIKEPTALDLTPSQTNVLCHGASTGKASIVVIGGVIPYSYSWDNGIISISNEATDLSAGAYNVTVTDANGCTITETFTISEPTALSITPSQTDVLCHGASTGTAGVVVSGGVTPYSYSWDNGITSTTNDATDLSAGTYKVTVTDANGCITTETFTISEPTALSITPSQTDVVCHGASTGKASVVVNGGVAPYSYSWNNGITSTTNEATDLSAGTYIVKVTDANGCTKIETFTITESTALSITPSQTDVLCHGALTGKASVAISGGIAPYSYLWNNGATSSSIDNLSAGTYTVIITDANGCETTASVTIIEPTKLDTTTIQTNVSCYGGTDGSGAVTVSGGIMPYLYNWDNGGTTSSIDSLKAGVYTVTITDANGCSQTQKITITEPAFVPAPSSSQPTQNFCKDENKAFVNLNITGTNIQWYDRATGGTALSLNTLLTSKTYYASQTVNGCESPSRKAITVNIYEALPLTSNSVTVCYNSAIQEVSIDGRPSGELKWYTNSSNTRALDPTHLLASGTYYVSTFVHNLCESARRAVQVAVLPAVPLPGTSQQVICGSGTVADLTAQSISGAVLKWYSTAQSTTPLAPTTNLLNGTYYVEQEVNGCRSGRKAVAVRVVSLPAPSMTNFVLCEGATVDNLQMAPISVNYVWFTDATTSIMLPGNHTLTTGYYYVAYESLGCISKRTRVHVKINARPVTPTGAVQQHFTTKSTVSNIKVNESNVVWYASYEDAVRGTNSFSNQHPLEDQTTYYGVLVSKEGCTSYPLAVQVTVTLGLNDFDLASLKYYPNPVTSELTVTYKDVIEQLDVYDLTGKWVKTQTYTSNLVKINLYDLALGTYMVRIKTHEGEQFIKIVKK